MTQWSPCPLCPRRFSPVPGEGPAPCRVACFAERPGKLENNFGRPFVEKAPAGAEFNGLYLPAASLSRDEIYVSNTVHCYENEDEPPTPELIRSCTNFHMRRELEEVQPDIVVLMGASACSLLAAHGNEFHGLELDHGFPRVAELWGRPYVVVPTYHPAHGLHKTREMNTVYADFQAVKRVVKGQDWGVPSDEFPEPDYRTWSRTPFKAIHNFIGVDTETDCGFPWSMQISVAPGISRFLTREDLAWSTPELLDDSRVLVHNAKFDLPVLAQMGVHLPPGSWFDTMQMAYNLNLPQSLKTLAYRLCGMRMQEYDEVLKPYADAEALEFLSAAELSVEEVFEFQADEQRAYLERALQVAVGLPKPGKVQKIDRNGKTRTVQAYTPLAARIPKWLEKGEKLADKWGKLDQELRAPVEAELGVMPGGPEEIAKWKRLRLGIASIVRAVGNGEDTVRGKWKTLEKDGRAKVLGKKMREPSLARIPFEEALHYSCRDSDACLRVFLKMRERWPEYARTS